MSNDKRDSILSRLNQLFGKKGNSNSDVNARDITDFLVGNKRSVKNNFTNGLLAEYSTSKGMANLDKKGGIKKIKRSRELNSRGYVDSKHPYLISGEGEYISTKINRNYERNYKNRMEENARRTVMDRITGDVNLDELEQNMYGTRTNDSIVMKKKFDAEIGRMNKSVQHYMIGIKNQPVNALGKRPPKVYQTSYDYFFDNSSVNPMDKNKNPLLGDIVDKISKKNGKIKDDDNFTDNSYHLTTDAKKKRDFQENTEILNTLRSIENSVRPRDNGVINLGLDEVNYRYREMAEDNDSLKRILRDQQNEALKDKLRSDDERDSVMSQIDFLDNKKTELNKSILEMEKTYSDKLKSRDTKYNEEMSEIRASLNAKNTELEAAKYKLEDLSSTISNINADNGTRDDLYSDRINDINNKITELNEYQRRLKGNSDEDEKYLRDEIESNQEQIILLKKSKDELLEFKNESIENMKRQDDNYLELRESNERLRDGLRENEEEKNSLNKKIHELKREYAATETIARNNPKLVVIKNEITGIQNKLIEKENEVYLLKRDIIELDNRNSEMEIQSMKNKNNFERQINDLDASNRNLQTRLQEKYAMLDDMFKVKAENNEMSVAGRGNLTDIEDMLEKINNEKEASRSKVLEVENKNIKQDSDARNEIYKLQNQLNNQNSEFDKLKDAIDSNKKDDDDDKKMVTNSSFPPQPPDDGDVGANMIVGDDIDEKITLDNIESEIIKTENQIDFDRDRLNRNLINSSSLVLRNAEPIDTDIPPSTTNPELTNTLSGINDPAWREFFKACITDSVFLRVLEHYGIRITETEYMIRINDTLVNDMSLLEFIARMSNSRYRLIPTILSHEGNFKSFLSKFMDTMKANDQLSAAAHFKYIVALYNHITGYRLQFRHLTEVTEEESLGVLFTNFNQLLYTLSENLRTMELEGGRNNYIFPSIMTTVLRNLKRYIDTYSRNMNLVMNSILEIIKKLSEESLRKHFIKIFNTHSSTWRTLVSKQNTNEVLFFKQYVTVQVFQKIVFECIVGGGISPPNHRAFSIMLSIDFDVIAFYNYAESVNSVTVNNFGRICMLCYVYIGITVNTDDNNNTNLLNNFINEFKMVMSQESLTANNERSVLPNFPSHIRLLNSLQSAYDNFLRSDQNAVINTRRISKFTKKKINKPYVKKSVTSKTKTVKKENEDLKNLVNSNVSESMLSDIGFNEELPIGVKNEDFLDDDPDNYNIENIEDAEELITEEKKFIEGDSNKILISGVSNKNKAIRDAKVEDNVLQPVTERRKINELKDSLLSYSSEEEEDEDYWEEDVFTDTLLPLSANDFRYDNISKNLPANFREGRNYGNISNDQLFPSVPTTNWYSNDMVTQFDSPGRNNNEVKPPKDNSKKRIVPTKVEPVFKKSRKDDFKTEINRDQDELLKIMSNGKIKKEEDMEEDEDYKLPSINESFYRITPDYKDFDENNENVDNKMINKKEEEEDNAIDAREVNNNSLFEHYDSTPDLLTNVTRNNTDSVPLEEFKKNLASVRRDIRKTNNDIKKKVLRKVDYFIKLLKESRVNRESPELYGENVRKTQKWLIDVIKEPVDESNARNFSELLASINNAIEVILPTHIVSYRTITDYLRSGQISSRSRLSSEESIILSIIYKAIVKFIKFGMEFKFMGKKDLKRNLMEFTYSALIQYLTDA